MEVATVIHAGTKQEVKLGKGNRRSTSSYLK